MDKIKIAGFTGSLRKGSYNLAALKAAQELMPEGAELEILDLAPLPFFNEDVEAAGIPQEVQEFNQKLLNADALLIATPEYNYSFPPALKNALDWASRDKAAPLNGKPLGIISASPGFMGGARAQYQLRQVCVILNLLPVNKPEVFIPGAAEKVDEAGNLTDQRAQKAITRLLQALIDKTRALKSQA